MTDDKRPALKNASTNNEITETELVRNPLPTTHVLLVKGVHVNNDVADLEAITEVKRFGYFIKLLTFINNPVSKGKMPIKFKIKSGLLLMNFIWLKPTGSG